MRSVVLESNIKDVCGICGAKEPLIEYKEFLKVKDNVLHRQCH